MKRDPTVVLASKARELNLSKFGGMNRQAAIDELKKQRRSTSRAHARVFVNIFK